MKRFLNSIFPPSGNVKLFFLIALVALMGLGAFLFLLWGSSSLGAECLFSGLALEAEPPFPLGSRSARIHVHISTVVEIGADPEPILSDLHKRALEVWNAYAGTPATQIYIPPEACMSTSGVTAEGHLEILEGTEWQGTLDITGLGALVVDSYKPGAPGLPRAIYWTIASDNPAFMAAVAERFQGPDFVKAMEEGGFTFLCTAVQDHAAGDFPAGRYSVHLFRGQGALPESLGSAVSMPLETSLYSLAFKDMGPLESQAGALPSAGLGSTATVGPPESQAGALPSAGLGSTAMVGPPELYAGAFMGEPLGSMDREGFFGCALPSEIPEGLGLKVDSCSYLSALEERPRSSGAYGDWAMPARPAFWQVTERYYYGWLEAGLATGPQPWYGAMVQDFYYHLAALIYFDPIPLQLRPTTIVTEVSPYFSYPFRDVVGLRPDVVDYLNSTHPSGQAGANPTEALCVGRLGFYREAAAGVRDCFGWGLHYRDHSAFLLGPPTVPLECTPPLGLTWAEQSAAFGPSGHWSEQRWLWLRDVCAYRLLAVLCEAYAFLWALVTFSFQSLIVVLCWCHASLWCVLYYVLFKAFSFSQLYYGLTHQALWLVLKFFYFSCGLLVWLLGLCLGASGSIVAFGGALGWWFCVDFSAHFFWFLQDDPRLAALALVHVLKACVWALAYGFYGLGPCQLVVIFFSWCYALLGLLKAFLGNLLLLYYSCVVAGVKGALLALCLGYYSCVVAGVKGALLALCLGYYSCVVAGVKGALLGPSAGSSLVGLAGSYALQLWTFGCSAFYGLWSLGLGSLQFLYSKAFFLFLLCGHVLSYVFSFCAGGPIPFFLAICFFLAFGSGFYGLYRLAVERPFQGRLRLLVVEKFYRKFFRYYLDTWFSHTLWWYLKVEHHILEKEVYSLRSSAFKLYIRMVVNTSLAAAYYSFCLGLSWALRTLLFWLAQSPLAPFISPIIYILQLRALGLKMQWDVVDYNFFWRALDTLRTGYYTLLNVDLIWSLAASLGIGCVQDPPRQEIPEKASVEPEGPGFFYAYLVSFFRPSSWGNHAAAALEPQRPKNKFLNLFSFFVFQVLYVVTFAFLGGLCLVIPGALRLHFFCLQLRLRFLNFLVWLESQPATAYVASWGRWALALLYSCLPRESLGSCLSRVLVPCYEWALLLLFVFTLVPRIFIVILKCVFYLCLRGRWLLLALGVFLLLGTGAVFYGALNLLENVLYDSFLTLDILTGRSAQAYVEARIRAPSDGMVLYATSEHWWKTSLGFWRLWIKLDLVTKTKVSLEGSSYLIRWFFYYCASYLPPSYFYVQRFALYLPFYVARFIVFVESPWWTKHIVVAVLGERLCEHLLVSCAQRLDSLGASAWAFLESLSQALAGACLKAFGLLPQAWTDGVLQSEAFIYGRWLLYYSFWDFFNYRLIGKLFVELWNFGFFYLPSTLLRLSYVTIGQPAIHSALWLVDMVLDAFWFDWAVAWALSSDDVLSLYSLKYRLWGHWQLFFDELCVHYKLKPLQLALEVVPCGDHNYYLENLFYEYFRSYNEKTSFLFFLHEPYVVWTIRQASVNLLDTLDAVTWNNRGPKKVIYGTLGLGLSHFWFLLALLLVSFKSLRLVLWVPAGQPYSGSYEWKAFREHPTREALEALVRVPRYVEAQYRQEQAAEGQGFFVYPGKPWKFYNLALLVLQDFYGTQDPVEALDLFLAQEGSHLGQRLASQGLLRRSWTGTDREALFSYIFRRRSRGEAAFGELRLRFQARKLFGPHLCGFLKTHRFDFLHWLLDPDKASLNANFISELSISQTMFLLAYLYSRDPHVAKVADTDEFEALEPVQEQYGRFIERNRWPLQLVYDYYAWLDSFFFGDLLPSWVCHKDALDSFYHEDLAPWLNTRRETLDPEEKTYYTTEEGVGDPYLPITLSFWFFWAPAWLLFMVFIMVFGLPDESQIIRFEVRQSIEMIFWSFDALEPINTFLGGMFHAADREFVPNSPDYKELPEEVDLCKGRRLSYGWDEATALGRDFHFIEPSKSFLGDVSKRLVMHFADLKPQWALFGGRAGYRFLAALMLLALSWNILRALVPAKAGLYLTKLSARFKAQRRRGPSLAPEYQMLWQRRGPFWLSLGERLRRSPYLSLLDFWRQRQRQRKPGLGVPFYRRLPQRLFFRDFYALKFYYTLKEHARVGIVAHGQKGYGLRGPRPLGYRGSFPRWWKKAKGL